MSFRATSARKDLTSYIRWDMTPSDFLQSSTPLKPDSTQPSPQQPNVTDIPLMDLNHFDVGANKTYINTGLFGYNISEVISEDGSIKMTKYLNYSADMELGEMAKAVDLWDAVKLKLDLRINDRCLREIKI